MTLLNIGLTPPSGDTSGISGCAMGILGTPYSGLYCLMLLSHSQIYSNFDYTWYVILPTTSPPPSPFKSLVPVVILTIVCYLHVRHCWIVRVKFYIITFSLEVFIPEGDLRGSLQGRVLLTPRPFKSLLLPGSNCERNHLEITELTCTITIVHLSFDHFPARFLCHVRINFAGVSMCWLSLFNLSS